MAFLFNSQFQVASDLHLETPLLQPSYLNFDLELHASYLCLLGDIGLIKDDGLFTFLEKLLKKTPNLTIFYVLGNHESYQISLSDARRRMNTFADCMKREYGNRFIFLDRRRHDISPTVTLLGCTLWTRILEEQYSEVVFGMTDFNEFRGIRDWTPQDHLDEHQKDLEWLNAEVARIQTKEPERQVVILTHHSPTLDHRSVAPRHQGSRVSSGFATDLSMEICWTSEVVKLWAFGHTHYSFSYRDESTSKLVVANQKGYNGIGAARPRIFKSLVVEATNPLWQIVDKGEEEEGRKSRPKPTIPNRTVTGAPLTSQVQSPPVKRASSLLSRLFHRNRG